MEGYGIWYTKDPMVRIEGLHLLTKLKIALKIFNYLFVYNNRNIFKKQTTWN